MNIFSHKIISIVLFTAMTLSLISCTHSPVAKNGQSTNFYYIQANKDGLETYANNSDFIVTTQVRKKEFKPRIDFYDFTVNSELEKFSITDIKYKYVNYGKWRIIDKEKYFSNSAEKLQSATIRNFPITVKKTTIPHNQLLQLTLKTQSDKIKHINLVFGIQKCISKKEKEFVCF